MITRRRKSRIRIFRAGISRQLETVIGGRRYGHEPRNRAQSLADGAGGTPCHSEPLPAVAVRNLLVNRDKSYYVYILASRSRNLYTGITSNLKRRVWQHRQGRVEGFTSKYRIHRLVHFECFTHVRDAIRREKQIKAWRRTKRVALISRHNPTWRDLAAGWYNSNGTKKADLSPRTGARARDDKARARTRLEKTNEP